MAKKKYRKMPKGEKVVNATTLPKSEWQEMPGRVIVNRPFPDLTSVKDLVVPTIDQHEGKKYLVEIHDAKMTECAVNVDVYSVIDAFKITCPAQAHACKKVLCAGNRGKGTKVEDLLGAIAALNRAVELERLRERRARCSTPSRNTPSG